MSIETLGKFAFSFFNVLGFADANKTPRSDGLIGLACILTSTSLPTGFFTSTSSIDSSSLALSVILLLISLDFIS